MLVDALLRGPVVVGADDEGGVGAGLGGKLRQPHGLGGGVGPGARHHEQAARGGGDALGDHPLVLVVGEGWGLTRRAYGADTGRAGLGLEVDLFLEASGVDLAVAKRRDDGDGEAGELLGSGGHREDPAEGVAGGAKAVVLADSGEGREDRVFLRERQTPGGFRRGGGA